MPAATELSAQLDRDYVRFLEKENRELKSEVVELLAEKRNYRYWRWVSAGLAILLVVIVVGACQIIVASHHSRVVLEPLVSSGTQTR